MIGRMKYKISFHQAGISIGVKDLKGAIGFMNFMSNQTIMKLFLLLLPAFSLSLVSCSQNNSPKNQIQVGGSCEGCEAVYECPVPFEQLSNVDTLPDFNDPGPKLEISGYIYHRDGKTPAADVVLYVYHTDQKGIYPKKGNENGWAKRHGYLRGWLKTGKDGFYKFYTLLPASYPDSKNPKHIHPTIKEPGKSEYWIDEYLFEGDPYLEFEKSNRPPRGGNGIVKAEMKDGMLRARRNIILGLNIPDYPVSINKKIQSGLTIGANCPAFDPVHLSGADKGKTACPMCKYGYGQGVMVWINHDDIDVMSEFLKKFEQEMEARGEKKLRVFAIYMNPTYKVSKKEEWPLLQKKLSQWCEAKKLNKVAVVWVPSPVDKESAALFKINPEAKNTVFVYKKRKVAAKWVNIDYSEKAADAILMEI